MTVVYIMQNLNIVWSLHGSQSRNKNYYLFPFKSLTFYVPNGHILYLPFPKISDDIIEKRKILLNN